MMRLYYDLDPADQQLQLQLCDLACSNNNQCCSLESASHHWEDNRTRRGAQQTKCTKATCTSIRMGMYNNPNSYWHKCKH